MESSDVEIRFDLARMDLRRTSDLIRQSYWGGERTDEANRKAFENSLCGAAFIDGQQVAFGRVITDRATFAYLADVIVWPEHRGRGVGKRLIRALLDHPDLAMVTSWKLTTRDAQTLYEPFGFVRMPEGRVMQLDRDTQALTAC